MIRAVYFDLFFTLITPAYGKQNNEFDLLGLSAEEWEKYAEEPLLYRERALGTVSSEMEIIEKIAAGMPFEVSAAQKQKVLGVRRERMRAALQNISDDIIDVLGTLKKKGIQIGLISNADRIDCRYWKESKLFPFFDDAVFSCDVGLLKPDIHIYKLAMQRLGVPPENCIFVGDGGSNELYGAKSAGMKTVFSEALEVKDDESRSRIMAYADHHIKNFREILSCIGE
ncbi:MAG: HAD-IA family hydrolase [Lachnospiraceae bacterium]|nr:HAD-IA family hydrolase [Lachnospiraceae bacterium]